MRCVDADPKEIDLDFNFLLAGMCVSGCECVWTNVFYGLVSLWPRNLRVFFKKVEHSIILDYYDYVRVSCRPAQTGLLLYNFVNILS